LKIKKKIKKNLFFFIFSLRRTRRREKNKKKINFFSKKTRKNRFCEKQPKNSQKAVLTTGNSLFFCNMGRKHAFLACFSQKLQILEFGPKNAGPKRSYSPYGASYV
jgi:hypothetical protein